MKRNIYLLCCVAACVLMLMPSCKREDKSAKVLAEYEALSERFSEDIAEAIEDETINADSIFDAFLNEAFVLQQSVPETEAAYAILKDLYYMFSLEQKEQAFAVLNIDSLDAYDLRRSYEAFLAEKNTTVGCPFVDFTAETVDGQPVAIRSLVGEKEFLLVDFWASWCGPCRRSMPELKELLAAYGDRLAIVSVSVDEDEEAWLQAIDALELTWTQLHDVNKAGSTAYGVTAIPNTVLIGRDGKIRARNPEYEDVEALMQ